MRPKSEIYTPKRDDEHPHPFHMRSPPAPGSGIQGPVVRTPVTANLGLNFNPSFFFLLLKALSRIIFSIPFRVSTHQIEGNENYLSSNFALSLGYLNPTSNNPAQALLSTPTWHIPKNCLNIRNRKTK